MINNIEFLLTMKLQIEQRITEERRHVEEVRFKELAKNMARANASDNIKDIGKHREYLQGQAFLMVQKGWSIEEIESLTVGFLVAEQDYLALRTKVLAKEKVNSAYDMHETEGRG